MKLNPRSVINVLKNLDETDKENIASTNEIIVSELQNCLEDTNDLINNVGMEKAAKFILWNGILNEYGILGNKRELPRQFKHKVDDKICCSTYLDKHFSRGKLLSIDFGVSSIGRELSYTHTGIVLADYVGTVVVVPITSKKEYELTKLSPDIQKVVILIRHDEYNVIKEDSYVLMNQLRAVSKNRITEVIGSVAKTELMRDIEKMMIQIHSPYMNKIMNEKIDELELEVKNLKEKIKKYESPA